MTTFNGLKVILDSNHVEDDKSRPNFPDSKHRSRRIVKKLLKRFGGKWAKKPRGDAIVSQQAGFMVIHPVAWEQLKRAIEAQQ